MDWALKDMNGTNTVGIANVGRPYLNKGNTQVRLRSGNVFTAEPGMFSCNLMGLMVRGVH